MCSSEVHFVLSTIFEVTDFCYRNAYKSACCLAECFWYSRVATSYSLVLLVHHAINSVLFSINVGTAFCYISMQDCGHPCGGVKGETVWHFPAHIAWVLPNTFVFVLAALKLLPLSSVVKILIRTRGTRLACLACIPIASTSHWESRWIQCNLFYFLL